MRSKTLEIGDQVVINPDYCSDADVRQFEGVVLTVKSKGSLVNERMSQWAFTRKPDASREIFSDSSYNFTYISNKGNPGEIHWYSARVKPYIREYDLEQMLDEAEDLL